LKQLNASQFDSTNSPSHYFQAPNRPQEACAVKTVLYLRSDWRWRQSNALMLLLTIVQVPHNDWGN